MRTTTIASILLVVCPLALGGCVSAEPTPAIYTTPPPKNPRPSRMVVTMRSFPQDKNSNGYPDTIGVAIHLFEPEGGWPLAVAIPGKYRFTALSPGGKQLAVWNFDPATLPGSIVRGQIGPTYIFELSFLTDGRTDRHDVETLDIQVVFTPEDATLSPIQSVLSTHFGRTR